MTRIAYSDLNLDFISHPLSLDVIPIRDESVIINNLRRIVLLRSGDIPFKSEYSGLDEYLFMPLSVITAIEIRTRLNWLIEQLEPRVKITNIDVKENDMYDGYDIIIDYYIGKLNITNSITLFFSRTR
jgi:phage baseplate assembly protein W